MKIYIRCMGKSRKDIIEDLDSKSIPLIEHLIKIILYQRRGNLTHWIDEVFGFIPRVDKLKGKNKFPDAKTIYHAMWDMNQLNLDRTVKYVERICKDYEPYTISIQDIESFVTSYLKWLAIELSEYGRVYPSDCEDVIRDLLSKYKED